MNACERLYKAGSDLRASQFETVEEEARARFLSLLVARAFEPDVEEIDRLLKHESGIRWGKPVADELRRIARKVNRFQESDAYLNIQARDAAHHREVVREKLSRDPQMSATCNRVLSYIAGGSQGFTDGDLVIRDGVLQHGGKTFTAQGVTSVEIKKHSGAGVGFAVGVVGLLVAFSMPTVATGLFVLGMSILVIVAIARVVKPRWSLKLRTTDQPDLSHTVYATSDETKATAAHAAAVEALAR